MEVEEKPMEKEKETNILINERKDFNPLCIFETKVTDNNGNVEYLINVKDSLTRYR